MQNSTPEVKHTCAVVGDKKENQCRERGSSVKDLGILKLFFDRLKPKKNFNSMKDK